MSVWHWLIFLAIVLLFFGGSGKISGIMGDVAKGIKSFKKGMAEDDEVAKKPEAQGQPKVIEAGKAPEAQAGAQTTKAG